LRVLVVQAFSRVLLEMKPLDADDHTLATKKIHHDLALAHQRIFILADLIALGQVGIEVVLPIEDRVEIDFGFQPETGTNRLREAALVDHREHPWHGGIDQAYMRVRHAAELGRGAREQLRVGGDLGMDFHADHHLPFAGGAFNEIVRFRAFLHVTLHIAV
jgi:hypothetical protein